MGVVSAFNFEFLEEFNFPEDTSIVYQINATGNVTDTNETDRINIMLDTNCTGTNKVAGFFPNGTVYCTTDQTGGGGGSGYAPTSINLTENTYNGNITNGSLEGYRAANAICNTEFGGHLCTEFEVMAYYANSTATTDINNSNAWINAGGPKYIPASVPVNDCNGWTYEGTTSYLGNYYYFNNETGGDSRALNCGSTFQLACCVY